jgi:hypothetical protein
MTVGTVCCDPKYSRATFVGIGLVIFTNLTGINVILFYSNKLFKGLSTTATMVTFLIGFVNFITSIIGLILLSFFGRKTLMLVFNALMSLTLFFLGYFYF